MGLQCSRVVLLLLLSFTSCLHGADSCLIEEKQTLLQIKDSLNYPNGSALSDAWIGEDCCSWPRVVCIVTSPSSVLQVYQLDLSNTREMQLGSWQPNATLFAELMQLQGLFLYGDQIGGWVATEGFRKMQNLAILDLSSNNLHESMDSLGEMCRLTNLEQLYLQSNNLTGAKIPPCLLTSFSSLVHLDLGNNNLSGSANILSGLCRLEKLYTLDLSFSNLEDETVPSCLLNNKSALGSLLLSGNNIQGTFGIGIGLEGLGKLEELDLSYNQLTDKAIFPWILNLTSIRSLSLQHNFLEDANTLGELCMLKNLDVLRLNDNAMEGNIASCFGEMHFLVSLDLSNNHLSGSIPPLPFVNLTSLATFSFSGNQLTGVFSLSTLANLSQLIIINLSDNDDLEVETENPTLIPKFQLFQLYLGNCVLNRKSSGMIPKFISTQYKLNVLYLPSSSIEGIIPSWLWNISTLNALLLSGNSLTSRFPQPSQHNMSNIIAFDISRNNLYGALPKNIELLFPKLYYLNASGNSLQGQLPSSVGKIVPLEALDLSSNNLSGSLPQTLGTNGSLLQYLSLSNNQLYGEVLSGYQNMTKLKYLNFRNNCFKGPISLNWSSIQLKFLDLGENCISGTIPSSLTVLPDLISLLLGDNFLEGHIPWTLCEMQNLKFLDLSNNNLSGQIPNCLDNNISWKRQYAVGTDIRLAYFYAFVNPILSADFPTKGKLYPYKGIPLSLMTGINLSVNNLSGNIPTEIGNLHELHSLNLSYNNLKGHLPESLKNMEFLESLDLSHNSLTGAIPPQIVQLDSLSVFSVAYNNLSDRIPYQNQFSTFDKSSYMGNPSLCGPPSVKNCSSALPYMPLQAETEQEDWSSFMDKPVLYYLFILASYALGLWATLALILFKRTWREKYFEGVDTLLGKIQSLASFASNVC